MLLGNGFPDQQGSDRTAGSAEAFSPEETAADLSSVVWWVRAILPRGVLAMMSWAVLRQMNGLGSWLRWCARASMIRSPAVGKEKPRRDPQTLDEYRQAQAERIGTRSSALERRSTGSGRWVL